MSVDQNTNALAKRPAVALEPWRSLNWQRLWLSLQARPWNVLAIVPASTGGPKDLTIKVAMTLARTGMIQLPSPIHVADAIDVDLSKIAVFIEEIKQCQQVGDRIVLALAPVSENPVSELLAQHADCSLLCIMFEQMAAADAKRTIAKIGKERFIGTTIFRPDDFPAK
jgi:hypothetical protein